MSTSTLRPAFSSLAIYSDDDSDDDDSDEEPLPPTTHHRISSHLHPLRLPFYPPSFQERPSMLRSQRASRVLPPYPHNRFDYQSESTMHDQFQQGGTSATDDQTDGHGDSYDSNQVSESESDSESASDSESESDVEDGGSQYGPYGPHGPSTDGPRGAVEQRSQPIPIPRPTNSPVRNYETDAHSLDSDSVDDVHPLLWLSFLPPAVRQRALVPFNDSPTSSSLVVGGPGSSRNSIEFDERVFY